MALLPDILPADPRDPENTRYHPRPVRYGLIGRIFMAVDKAMTRRDLADLDDAMLRDIGLTRDAARQKGKRGFWDVNGSDARRWHMEADKCFSRPGLL